MHASVLLIPYLSIYLSIDSITGRNIKGNVAFLLDVLSKDADQRPSILVVGPPGTGKTTIIRELAHLLTVDLELEVLIIDTSNEIDCGGWPSTSQVSRNIHSLCQSD